MCIRDSLLIKSPLNEQQEKYLTVIKKSGANLLVIINDILAVSYTHLRAHETVLDLVCRLLLETKKTTPPSLQLHI